MAAITKTKVGDVPPVQVPAQSVYVGDKGVTSPNPNPLPSTTSWQSATEHATANGPAVTAAPGYSAPAFNSPAPFTPTPWQAPTLADVQNEPGYQFGLDEGRNSIEATAASRGMTRHPNTLTALYKWGADYGTTKYGEVRDRSLNEYLANTGVQGSAWDRNLGLASAQYGAASQNAQAEYAPGLLTWQQQQRANELAFDRTWQKELYGKDDAYRRESRDLDRTDRAYYYNQDDAWRHYLEDQNNRRFVVSQGNY